MKNLITDEPSNRIAHSLLITIATCLLLSVTATAQEKVAETDVRAADTYAATYTVSHFTYHLTPANTTAGRELMVLNRLQSSVSSKSAKSSAISALTAVPAPGFYPSDLVFFGGARVTAAQSHNVYLNCPSTCWGNPAGFLTDLGNSTFVHVTDQYIGSTANGRYTLGTAVSASQTLFTNTLGQTDLLALVHAAAIKLGASTHTGDGHIYHVFLPKGVDTCFDQTSICYSPDNPSSFSFCAYHASVTFGDIGHVLLTVEPFQNVAGCIVAAPYPNNALTDSTDSVLSHELFETITDPDGNAWISDSSLDTAGFEIGDLCQPLYNNGFLAPTFTIGAHSYKVQLEYSNKYHACANVP